MAMNISMYCYTPDADSKGSKNIVATGVLSTIDTTYVDPDQRIIAHSMHMYRRYVTLYNCITYYIYTVLTFKYVAGGRRTPAPEVV